MIDKEKQKMEIKYTKEFLTNLDTIIGFTLIFFAGIGTIVLSVHIYLLFKSSSWLFLFLSCFGVFLFVFVCIAIHLWVIKMKTLVGIREQLVDSKDTSK